MSEWESILLEAEDIWENCVNGRYAGTWDSDKEKYKIDRDVFKARRIYELYGYNYFLKFIAGCPHIKNYFNDLVPCEDNKHNKKECILNATE